MAAEHWCKEHQQKWFKKGKMKGYAHPIMDEDGEPTGDWCNEPATQKPIESNGIEMSKDDWAQKQRIERESIEAQAAMKAMLSSQDNDSDTFKRVYEKSLLLAEQMIDMRLKAIPKVGIGKPDKVEVVQPGEDLSPDQPTITQDETAIDALLRYVMENKNYTTTKTARAFIVKILPEAKIDEDPDGVKKDIAKVCGWTL